jgi:NADPH-dependent glutamate synthase beta subunit-like oxidoreductase
MIMQINKKQAGDQRFNAPVAKGPHIIVIGK